jgi:hypothetical protein
MPAKAILFRVEWDNGAVWTAEGDVAAKVMQWYQGTESMACIHGARYSGPQITITESKPVEATVSSGAPLGRVQPWDKPSTVTTTVDMNFGKTK